MAWIRCIGNKGGSLKLNTASGAIASFETNLPEPLQSVLVNVEATQSGSGTPYPAGGGVNRWDEEWEAGGINGTTGANNSESGCIRSKNYISVYPGQTLYFKAPSTWTAHSVRGRCYKADETFLQTLSFNDNTVFTIPADCYLFRFVTPANANVTTYNHDISINYPATDTAYHPYANVRPINGYSSANVTRCGVNILGGETFADLIVNKVPNAVKNTTTKTVNYTGQNIDGIALFDKFKPNTQYTFFIKVASGYQNLKINYTDGTKTQITTFPYTSTANKTILNLSGEWQSGTSVVSYDECGIFEGVKTAADFAPYNGQTYTIAFGHTVYGGVLDVTRGKLHVTWGGVDLGAQTWTYNSSNSWRSPISDSIRQTNPNTRPNWICSHYPISTQNNPTLPSLSGLDWFTGVCFWSNDYTTAEQVKTAMNGVILAYKLATPFDIDITPEVISAIVGTNNVYSDTNGDTEVKYLEVVRN